MTGIVYTGPTSIAFTSMNALASSATFVAGGESAQVDNTSNLYIDALVQGLVLVGTTPTVGIINVYVWGSHTSLATTAIDVLDGTDSVETITSVGVLQSMLKLAAQAFVDATTSNRSYYFAPFSVAALFGGRMPQFWGLYGAHNTVAALNASNPVWNYTGIEYA